MFFSSSNTGATCSSYVIPLRLRIISKHTYDTGHKLWYDHNASTFLLFPTRPVQHRYCKQKKPVLGMKKFSFPQIVTVNVSNEFTVQKLNTANHRNHWLTSSHYESRGELFHMWGGITEISNVSTQWIYNVQLNRKPCKPVPAWPFLLAVCKVHTDICYKNIGSASTYFNVGLYMLLQNTVADSNYPKSYWNSLHLHLLVH